MKTATQPKTTYQKNVKFFDNTDRPVYLEISIKGYFAISGVMQGSSGQITDSIKPANAKQQQLLKIWADYHLMPVKDLPKDLPTIIDELTIHMEKFDGSPYTMEKFESITDNWLNGNRKDAAKQFSLLSANEKQDFKTWIEDYYYEIIDPDRVFKMVLYFLING